jgi:hypothetical protein
MTSGESFRTGLSFQKKYAAVSSLLGYRSILKPHQTLQQTDNDLPIPTGLLSLPPEILLHIFIEIAHSPSQIAFALTCKQIARLASRVDLSLSLASPRYAGFLPVSVFDVPDLMNYLKPWMPPHLRLCGHCLTYRPSSSDYWRKVPGHDRNDFWVRKSVHLFLFLFFSSYLTYDDPI